MNDKKTAVLFIHGFLCSARFFDQIKAELADTEADLVSISLAGHDASYEDFRSNCWRDWQESADLKLRELSDTYDRVLLVGHSMGGLIALRAAVAMPEKVIGVVGIGFPIKISLGPRWIKLNAAATKPKVPGEDPRVTAAREFAGVPIRSVGDYFKTLPQNIGFLKTAGAARREISQLRAPLTVINFERDEIVAPSVPRFVKDRLPGAEIAMLPKSYHFLFAEDERRRIAGIIREYIDRD